MNDKLLRLLGLSRRAGALSYGIEGVKADIKRKKALVILTASDLSENTKKELLRELGKIPIINTSYTKEEIGHAIGTKPTGIVSINDRNLKNGILEVNLFENKKEDI